MTFYRTTGLTALATIIATGAWAEGGYAPPAPGPVIYNAPDPTNIGYVELSFGAIFLDVDAGSDDDFDVEDPIFNMNGQAFARLDNFVLELQGTHHLATDDNAIDEETATSFGAIGHYVFDAGPGTAGAFVGLIGGSHIDENEGTGYFLLGGEYALNGFVGSVGYAANAWGEFSSADETLDQFYYLSLGYDYQLNDQLALGASGYYGLGDLRDDPDQLDFYELALEVGYDVSDRLRVFGGASYFGLGNTTDFAGDETSGYVFNVGLSIAIGGSNATAREQIPFDTPYLHREITWFDALN